MVRLNQFQPTSLCTRRLQSMLFILWVFFLKIILLEFSLQFANFRYCASTLFKKWIKSVMEKSSRKPFYSNIFRYHSEKNWRTLNTIFIKVYSNAKKAYLYWKKLFNYTPETEIFHENKAGIIFYHQFWRMFLSLTENSTIFSRRILKL